MLCSKAVMQGSLLDELMSVVCTGWIGWLTPGAGAVAGPLSCERALVSVAAASMTCAKAACVDGSLTASWTMDCKDPSAFWACTGTGRSYAWLCKAPKGVPSCGSMCRRLQTGKADGTSCTTLQDVDGPQYSYIEERKY